MMHHENGGFLPTFKAREMIRLVLTSAALCPPRVAAETRLAGARQRTACWDAQLFQDGDRGLSHLCILSHFGRMLQYYFMDNSGSNFSG